MMSQPVCDSGQFILELNVGVESPRSVVTILDSQGTAKLLYRETSCFLSTLKRANGMTKSEITRFANCETKTTLH